MICDICGRDVRRLNARQTGKYGLDLCDMCYSRMRQRQQAALKPAPPELAPGELPPGPPFTWPRCEWCGDDVDAHGLGYYTRRGTPRLCCSVECTTRRNQRIGLPIVAAILRQRVREGTWIHPMAGLTPEQVRAINLRAAAAAAEVVHARMEDGTWHPPPRDGPRPNARYPRKHAGNPDFYRACQKRKLGARLAELTPAEREASRAYQRAVLARTREARNDRQREARRAQLSDPVERAALRGSEARARARLSLCPRNTVLIAARTAAGLTRRDLAAALGVSKKAVDAWERHSAVPRDPDLRHRVADLLGTWPWPEKEPDFAGPP